MRPERPASVQKRPLLGIANTTWQYRSLTLNGQIKTASAERLCNIDHRYRIAGRRYEAFAFDDENNPPNCPPTSVLLVLKMKILANIFACTHGDSKGPSFGTRRSMANLDHKEL